MPRRIAITRGVSPHFERCELTHRSREPIDMARAQKQHRAYEEALVSLGCELVRLPAEPAFPDSVFVEDTAIVLAELAIVTRPGAASRRGETDSIARALEPYRRLVAVEEPGTLDGGDVLQVGQTLHVGQSTRTNASGLEQLQQFVEPYAYRVVPVPVRGTLHLKSSVTSVTDRTLLINRRWVDANTVMADTVGANAFQELDLIDVDPTEPDAANALRLDDIVLFPASFPRTRRQLEEHGIHAVNLDMSEFAKAEGGLTCCSLILDVD
jgi:dimethylargininase